jgi:hypothetical protein
MVTSSSDSVILWEFTDPSRRANHNDGMSSTTPTLAPSVALPLHEEGRWKKKRTLEARAAGIAEARLSARGDVIWTLLPDSIIAWNTSSFANIATLTPPQSSPASASGVGTTTASVPTTTTTRLGMRTFAISSNNEYVCATGNAPEVYLWLVSEQRFLRVISLPAATRARSVIQITFITNDIIAVLCDSGPILLVHVTSLKLIRTLLPTPHDGVRLTLMLLLLLHSTLFII